jgi:quercetin dioxygenase-like cupin family protein
MKKSICMMIACVLLLVTAGVKAQDVCKSNPSHCQVLQDTAGVKLVLITLKPGDKLQSHTHPWNFGYVLKGGEYKWTYADGKTESATLKAGDSFAGAPEGSHFSWNGGNTIIQFVLYEKQH